MKKIFFTLLALVGTMSMNAQVMQVMKGNTVVATYTAEQADNVVFMEAITGTAERTGGVSVNWVQLWNDGPKFAEYNVGVTDGKAESFGGYYNWGKTTNKDTSGDYNKGYDALTGTDDTATKLWGSKWRMPKKAELEALLNNQNCTCTWTTQNGVKGLLCKGKENTAYSSNSVFLPAAGRCFYGGVNGEGDGGFYWSSTPNSSSSDAYGLDFESDSQSMYIYGRYFGFSVRAVLAE